MSCVLRPQRAGFRYALICAHGRTGLTYRQVSYWFANWRNRNGAAALNAKKQKRAARKARQAAARHDEAYYLHMHSSSEIAALYELLYIGTHSQHVHASADEFPFYLTFYDNN